MRNMRSILDRAGDKMTETGELTELEKGYLIGLGAAVGECEKMASTAPEIVRIALMQVAMRIAQRKWDMEKGRAGRA
jgi:hypothetical protein